MTDIGGDRLGPGAGQGAEAEATVGGDPGLCLGRIVERAGDARQHAFDNGSGDRAVARHGHRQPVGEGIALRAAHQQLRVIKDRLSVRGLEETVGRDPGIEQTGDLERRLEAGALGLGHRLAKVDELPERSTRTGAAQVRVAGVWRRRACIDARFETGALVFEGRSLALQSLTPTREQSVALGQSLRGALLGSLQRASRRIVARQADHPLGQRVEGGRRFVRIDSQNLQPFQMTLPMLEQDASGEIHFGVRFAAT